MNKSLISIALAGILTISINPANAAHHDPLSACVKVALAKHPGRMDSLSYEFEDGKSQFEIDIKGNDGRNWEVECDASSGKINRIEREISASAPEFKSKAKIRLDAALKIALDKYPGDVINIEYDLEDDGEISYEFIIKTQDGKTIEIEVDAESGKLAGYEEVIYRIGN